MNELILILRISISFLFISTAMTKIMHFKKHLIIVAEYKMLPNKTIKFFALIEVILELSCALFLLLGLFPNLSSLGLLILLTFYTLGILINLMRGRKHISCGCGGFIGNHQLSWFLVLRNTILFVILLFLFQNKITLATLQEILFNGSTFSHIFSNNAILSIFIAICFILYLSIFRLFLKLNDYTQKFLNFTKNLKER
ncbi:MauE/DoxX family redox-associated membrane protein [Bacillus wiedmannii]|uniref:MauE/DoxX family redox-associated membrane protein n=1 Tax=Bacillus wiedmannii TaxID=1890302 RepID=UPI002E1AC058|nr:MauE/DoxX family redox-associated membrane protein [Bacillus wiedmannii]